MVVFGNGILLFGFGVLSVISSIVLANVSIYLARVSCYWKRFPRFCSDEISDKIAFPPFMIVSLSGRAMSLARKDKGKVQVGQSGEPPVS